MSDQEEREALADSVKTAERLEGESRKEIPVTAVTLPKSPFYGDERRGVTIKQGGFVVEFFQDAWVFARGEHQGMVVPGVHAHYDDAVRRAWDARKHETRREDYIEHVRKREEMAEKAKQPAEVVARMQLDALSQAKDCLRAAGLPESFRVDIPWPDGVGFRSAWYELKIGGGEA